MFSWKHITAFSYLTEKRIVLMALTLEFKLTDFYYKCMQNFSHSAENVYLRSDSIQKKIPGWKKW